MTTSKAATYLSWIIALMAIVASGLGLGLSGGANPAEITSFRNTTVELYGNGLYDHDSLLAGAGNRGTDLTTLVIGVPLLLVSTFFYRRGSVRGGLVLLGTIGYFVYVYASYALGAVMYNELFFLYVALVSASFNAVVLVFVSFDRTGLGRSLPPTIPRRGPAIFMLVSGVATFAIWALPVIGAQLRGDVPDNLDHYTTLFTVAFDIALIVPATATAGVLILRRDPVGYVVASSLLVLEVMLLPLIVVQTIAQATAGVEFSAGEVVGPIAGFVVLASAAGWFFYDILRHVRPMTGLGTR